MQTRFTHALTARGLYLFVAVAAGIALAGCAASPEVLNSERITAKFGSYHVSVLSQDEALRVSSLASQAGDRRITRTLAIVQFAPEQAAYAELHQRILAGSSIGSTFREAGWQISKPLLYTGHYAVSTRAGIVGELMEISLPAELAMHGYRFEVSKNGHTYTYATLIELHHPDYLGVRDLVAIYGSRSAADGAGELAALTGRVLAGLSADAGR